MARTRCWGQGGFCLTESKNTDSAAALEQSDSSETVKKLTWTKSLRVAEKKVEGEKSNSISIHL